MERTPAFIASSPLRRHLRSTGTPRAPSGDTMTGALLRSGASLSPWATVVDMRRSWLLSALLAAILVTGLCNIRGLDASAAAGQADIDDPDGRTSAVRHLHERVHFDLGPHIRRGFVSADRDQHSSSSSSPSQPPHIITVRRHKGSQIYVPCGVKFKTPRKKLEPMTHPQFFDNYRDVYKVEADRYNISKIAGKGSYGIVAEAVDLLTGETVAIKKMIDVFMRRSDALRNLRELKLLRLMKHSEDIIGIRHVLLPSNVMQYTSIFFVMEKMEKDMREMVRISSYLAPEVHQVTLFQILRGMSFMHSANVYHRDMKPSNILINSDCKVKICDFSLARPVFNKSQALPSEWTGYVATRWYRPPEMCLTKYTRWTHAMDVWGIGCVFMEAIMGKPLFPGKDAEGQIGLITDLLGAPPAHVIDKYPIKVQEVIAKNPDKPAQDMMEVFKHLPRDAVRISARMLVLDPDERPTPQELLQDPYFADLTGMQEMSGVPTELNDFAFSDMKRTLGFAELRQMLYHEVLFNYHKQGHSSSLLVDQGWPSTRIRKGAALRGSSAPVLPRISQVKVALRQGASQQKQAGGVLN